MVNAVDDHCLWRWKWYHGGHWFGGDVRGLVWRSAMAEARLCNVSESECIGSESKARREVLDDQ
jgi:hypothetical protein